MRVAAGLVLALLALAGGLWLLGSGGRREVGVSPAREARSTREHVEPQALLAAERTALDPEPQAEPDRIEPLVANADARPAEPEPAPSPAPDPDTAVLEGHVLDVHAAGVDGVLVIVQAPGRRFGQRVDRTDERGAWRIEGLTAGIELAVRVRGPGRTHDVPGTLVLQPGEVRELDVVVGRGATIRGRVTVAETGAPVEDAEVWLLAGGGHPGAAYLPPVPRPAQTARSEADGAFELSGLSPGSWLVGVSPWQTGASAPDEAVWVGGRARRVDVALEDLVEDVELVVHAGLFVRGVVVDFDGSPVAHARVLGAAAARPASTQAETDGTFALGPLLPEEYVLRANVPARGRPDLASSPPVHARPGDEVTLRLQPGATLRGRVIDPAGLAVPGAEVELVGEAWTAATTALEEGRFVFLGLASGDVALSAWTHDLYGSVERVTLLAGAETPEVTLRLAPAARLVVRCSTGAGRLRVQVRPARGPAAGQSFLPGASLSLVLPPGPAEIEAHHVDPASTHPDPASRVVILVAGEETAVDLGDP